MMNQALTVARSRTNASIPRCLSSVTTSPRPTKSSTTNDYAEQRRVYNAQLVELRKGWTAITKVKKEKAAVEAIVERKRVVLQKAIDLRIKRAEGLLRQEKGEKRVLISRQLFREHVARSQVIREQRHTVQEARHSRLVQDLVEEKDQWITYDNLNFKVTDNLFTQPSTTGLVTRASNLYRFQIIPQSVKRLLADLDHDGLRENGLKERLEEKGQLATAKKLMVAEFLETMIGTGSERSKYEEYVEKFSAIYEEEGAFDGEYDELQEYLNEGQKSNWGGKLVGKATSSFAAGKDRRSDERNARRLKDEADQEDEENKEEDDDEEK